MQKLKFIIVILVVGVLGSLIRPTPVEGAFPCEDVGYQCGVNSPNCWDEYCSSSCGDGCSFDSCSGGTCNSYCDWNNCPDGCRYPTTSGGVCNECTAYCDSSCAYGCSSESCSGGTCNTPSSCDDYCWSGCAYGCSSEDCDGGVCNSSPTPTSTPTPTNAPEICSIDELTCIDGYEYICSADRTDWDYLRACAYGCDTAADVCSVSSYCEDVSCGDCTAGGETGYRVMCWSDETQEEFLWESCIAFDSGYTQDQCETRLASNDPCHAVNDTCGGLASCVLPLVSRIDSCGWQACGVACEPPPVDGGGDPVCVASYPVKAVLSLPVSGGSTDTLSVNLSWSPSTDYGNGCPQNNGQTVFLEAGDSSPDIWVASLFANEGSYTASGLEGNKQYYWRVMSSNGSLDMYSDVYSFITPGIVTGTLFDASDIDSCALMGSAPKISGSLVNIVGGVSYAPVTDVLGVYSQIVGAPDSYVVTPVVSDPYSSTPKLTCQGASADFVVGGPETVTLDFGFWRIYGGWWQAIGGDVYGGGGIESVVPVDVPANERYLIKNDANGNGGLAQYGTGGVIELGDGDGVYVSESGWEAESGYGGQDVNYEYYTAKMKVLEKTVWSGVGKPVYSPGVDGYEIYTYTGDATVNFDVSGGERMVFMIDGNVTVSSDVTVALGSHLTVISSGNITFDSNVGEVHGWWVADRIVIESTGDTATELQFKGEGSFVGWDAVELNRDRGVTNNTEPAEEFTYRSDLMVNAPRALKFSRYKWLEQAP